MSKIDLTEPERQLIELLRHQDVENFTVEINADNGRWQVRLEDHDSGKVGDGIGAHFSDAWHNVVSRKFRNRPRS
jgi:hypothetical protein